MYTYASVHVKWGKVIGRMMNYLRVHSRCSNFTPFQAAVEQGRQLLLSCGWLHSSSIHEHSALGVAFNVELSGFLGLGVEKVE